MKHVCFFRHGLSLDENRVKMLPEYGNGGAGPRLHDTHMKEVWFTGSHSDMSVSISALIELFTHHSRNITEAGEIQRISNSITLALL